MSTPAGAIVVVRVFGDIDLNTHHVLRAALTEARQRGPSYLVVDVAGMGFCSVPGLALLVGARAEPAAHRAEYLLSGVAPHIERFLGLLWPADTLPSRYPTAGAAVLAAMAHQHERTLGPSDHPARRLTEVSGGARRDGGRPEHLFESDLRA